jgi:surfactin synthase thioesterase subunit
VIALKRQVSLTDITRYPTLADLAGLVDGRSQRSSGLLQELSEPGAARDGALVCFPYAGGNAVNFRPLAGALRDNGRAVYAVELPGHDLTAESEAFAPMAQIVEQVVGEILERGLTGVMLWGHSVGAAFALATAPALLARGVEVRRVFLGAQLLGDAAGRRAAIARLNARSDAEIAADLVNQRGYTELGELDAQRAEHVGAAYRHDCISAHRWFAELLDDPPPVRLAVPVTVVAAADDPYTAAYAHRYREWQLLAEHVDLHELAGGSHYFLRTRPAEAAQAVARALAASS